MILFALHNQGTAGDAGGHVIEVRIYANYDVIVFNIGRGIIRIGVPTLSSRHLIGHAGHGPALRGIVGVIVRINVHIAARYIGNCNIINYLLAVGGQCIVYGLRHARRNGCGIRGEYGIVFIFRLRLRLLGLGFLGVNWVRAVRIACQIEQIIRKCITACLAQGFTVGKIGQRIGAFKRADQRVVNICVQHLVPYAGLGNHAAEAVSQEIGSAVGIRKRCGKVAFYKRTQRRTFIHLRNEIKCIQIAVKVRIGE